MSEKVNPDDQDAALVQGRDFYMEKGYMVFTEFFLLQRGKCCGSGCRHCPYRKRKEKNTP